MFVYEWNTNTSMCACIVIILPAEIRKSLLLLFDRNPKSIVLVQSLLLLFDRNIVDHEQ